MPQPTRRFRAWLGADDCNAATSHSSSKAKDLEPRQVLHIEYADILDFGSGTKLAAV
jgi:hypothetical protein